MINISHQQAQRLLRVHLDERLPNEQWMVLQAHLETCASCREYNNRFVGLEKSLRRALRSGWESAHGPDSGTVEHVVMTFQLLRPRRRKRLLIAGAAAVLILAILLLGGPAGIIARFGVGTSGQSASSGAPSATLTAVAGIPTAALQSTVEPGQFAEVIAYEGRRDGLPDGDHEIFLLNPGSASVNLTNNPAQDTSPAWSPDGEWLAFLSDRSGKEEVYVTNITGSKVVQLTDEAGITWQSPLSWSPDGKWIALGGTRDQQGSENWVYLVAIDGGGARALAGSRGGDSPKFAPSGGRIAYHFSDGANEGIVAQNLETGGQVITKWIENPLVPSPATGSAFDWSPDGLGLVYVSADPNPVASANRPALDVPLPSGEPGSQVFTVRGINGSPTPLGGQDSYTQIDSSRWPGAFRGASWSPGGAVAYLEDLADARANDKPGTQPRGCWSIQLSFLTARGANNQNTSTSASFGGLCVEGGLNQASWTADGSWVVVQGRLPSENRLSIYALRVPARSGRNRNIRPSNPTPGSSGGNTSSIGAFPGDAAQGTILRLTSDFWPGPLPAPRPQPNSYFRKISIDPRPVKKTTSSLPPSDMSKSRPKGKISYVMQHQSMSVVVSANPDGTGGRVLLATPEVNQCPTWSPDGKAIALVQLSGDSQPAQAGAGEPPLFTPKKEDPEGIATGWKGLENIYVLDTGSREMRQISLLNTVPTSVFQPDQVYYSCPVWSPIDAYGDRSLAVLMSDGWKSFLAVLPASTSGQTGSFPAPRPRYLPIPSSDWSLPPVWSSDGKTIFLLSSKDRNTLPGVTIINVPGDPQAPLTAAAGPPSLLSQTARMAAIMPGGLAMVQLDINGPTGSAYLHRMFFSAVSGTNEVGQAVYLDQGQQAMHIVTGSVTWLYGSIFGVTLRGGPQDRMKTMFYVYDLYADQAQALAASTDTVNSAAWSPDGSWLVFSAESGLWGVDVQAALQGKVGPVWLSPQPVQDLDWN